MFNVIIPVCYTIVDITSLLHSCTFQFQNIGLVGGRHLSECMARTMSYSMAHEVVHKFSRTGKGKDDEGVKKVSFDNLQNVKRIVTGMQNSRVQFQLF